MCATLSDVGQQPREDPLAAAGDLVVYSVGHSNVAAEGFLRVIQSFKIDVIGDVRTTPRSGFVPHFDGRPLSSTLRKHEVDYVFLGDTLGGRPRGDEFYDDRGYVLYYRVAETPEFRAGLARLIGGARQYTVAMMCAEEDPAACHRHRLIAHALEREDVRVTNIRHDGTTESTADVDRRILGETQSGLFDVEDRAWTSSRSVLPKRPLNSSSTF